MPDKKNNQGIPDKTSRTWRRLFLNRWLLTGVTAIMLYAMLGFVLAPHLVTSYVTRFSKETLNRQAAIGEVRVNPFLFTLDATNFSLTEPDGHPIIDVKRLFVDFELSSLFSRAWTFADILMEQPSVHISIEPDGHLNLASLADSLPKSEGPPPEKSPPPRLVVQHAEIVDGSITFSDLADTTPATETFAPLNIEFKEISTLPDQRGQCTIHAALPGGGAIGWNGKISLHPLFSEGHVRITDFKLATAWKFAQDELNLSKPEGNVNFNTAYRFDHLEQTPCLVLEHGNFELNGLKLIEKHQKTPLVSLETIKLSEMGFDSKKQLIKIPKTHVSNGRVAALVDNKGELNWQILVTAKKPSKKTAPVAMAPTSNAQPWKLNADALTIENIALDYKDNSRVNPLALRVDQFNLSLKAAAQIGGKNARTILESLKVRLTAVALLAEGNDSPLITLDRFALEDGRIDIGNRAITIPLIEITGGGAHLVRGKKGRIHIIEAFAPADRGMLKRKIAITDENARAKGNPWSFRLDSFELNGFETALVDQTVSPDIHYTLQDIRTSLKNISNDGKTPIYFDAGLKVFQGGQAHVKGQFGQTGNAVDATVKITELNLTPLQPAVAEFTTLTLESGNVSASADLAYQSAESGPKVRAEATVMVDDLKLNEAATGERILEWKRLSASGMTFGLAPDQLNIRELKLMEPGAKMVVFKDRSFNLAKLSKSPSTAGSKKNPRAASSNQAGFPVRIDSMRLENGTVDFSDLSLMLPFITQVTDLNGGISSISSAQQNRSAVQFEGRVDKFGRATMKGSLLPFAPKTFTDLNLAFQNVKMTSLSPYTATFAGRKISSGALNLNLEYKINNSELRGENSVILNRFSLGERVEAPNAVSLPLDLAIALLTDTQGKINIAVPVSGNLDDPKFSYGHVIWQAVANLITKAVTAPFRALGNLFGGENKTVDVISFNPGSHQLLPPEQEKLQKVAQALKNRPQLKLVVLGRFDVELDGKTLRTERVKQAFTDQMGQEIPADQAIGPLVFDTENAHLALEKLMEKRSGPQAVSEFQARYKQATAGEVNPANPDTAFYQALFDELVKLEPLEEASLQRLAQSRAKVIEKEFNTTSGLDESRVAVGDVAPVEKPEKKRVKTRLQLDVLKAPAPHQ
ncbi:DUF748 domain-containing protein [Desulfobacula sp.]|uniref:DUF748 domain-containing protein n=1 Tax=Desulfobacula sp. TaxID=2593537 RepID=UPI002631806F|nr:DUF748 domain-containing protein [Desulfobacula sp.]